MNLVFMTPVKLADFRFFEEARRHWRKDENFVFKKSNGLADCTFGTTVYVKISAYHFFTIGVGFRTCGRQPLDSSIPDVHKCERLFKLF